MAHQPKIEILTSDDAPEARELGDNLLRDVEREFGASDRRTFTAVIRKKSGELSGGVRGFSHWKWLYISQLWVAPEARSSGLGSKLIQAAESEARTRGCVGLYVDTFHPRAAAFYRREGFKDSGKIANFPPGHERIYLSKIIAPAE